MPKSSSTQYEVHVMSVYEGNRHTRPPSAGDTNVNILSGNQSGRAIVLVFASYEPVNWILNLPAGITISKVILVSIREKHLNQRSMSDTIWRRKKLVSDKTFAVYSQNLQLNNRSVPRKIKDVKLFYHLGFFSSLHLHHILTFCSLLLTRKHEFFRRKPVC